MKAVIFDVGGVLRESSLAIMEGFRRCFEKAGLRYNIKQIDLWHLRGFEKFNDSRKAIEACFAVTKADEDLGRILEKDDAEEILSKLVIEKLNEHDQALISIIKEEYKRFFASEEAGRLVKIQPGAEEAVNMLKGRYKLGIFTNAMRATVERDIAPLGLENFSVIVAEEDVKNKKPSGEGIVIACEKLSMDTKEAVYIGDAVSDITAARDAGCISAVVTNGMGIEKHLRKEKPDFVFKNLLEAAKELCD